MHRFRQRNQVKLCAKFCSPSYLKQSLPIIHHNNIRLIQSFIFNDTQTAISRSQKSSHFHPLQYFNHRKFSLPDHEIIGLPALSPSVEESKIVSWKKNEGELVAADEPIASVQTDKAELDWQVTDDVYLAKILLEPGVTVPVGTPAAIFVEEKAHVAAFKNYTTDSATPSPSTPIQTNEPTPSKPTSPSIPSPSTKSNYPEHKIEGMPALSPTAVDGALVEWLVKEGDFVEEGTGIAEIQTDKSVVTWTSTDEAYIAKLLVPTAPDDKLPVGTPLAVFVDDKNDVAAFKDFVVGADNVASAPSETPTIQEATQTPSGRVPSIQFRHGVRDGAKAESAKRGRIFASPFAKKLAEEMGIDLDEIGTSSGNKGGRIIASDVIKTAQDKKQKDVFVAAPVSIERSRTFEDIPVSVMREIIGQRLSESKFSSPHFYVTTECSMDNLLRMREEMNDGEDMKISVNDFVIKACGAALRGCMDCNVGWVVNKESGKAMMRKYDYVDISVAVATPSGLITPIIKDVDIKSIKEVSLEMKDLAKRAKDNKLLPEEFQGGTFTISNMGMYKISNFTAIINPPQACILAVGGAKQRLIPDTTNSKGFRTSTIMEVTLSSDHRAVDGALAAFWINQFQKYMEKPSKLLL